MSWFQRKIDWFDQHITMKRLAFVISILIIILLFMVTGSFWKFLYGKTFSILKPFIYGFIIAYLMNPVARFFEKYGIKRYITIPILWIVLVLFFLWLFSSIVPNFINDMIQLVKMTEDGVAKLLELYTEWSHNPPSPFIKDIVSEIQKAISSMGNMFKNLPSFATSFLGTAMDFVTTTIFSFTISLYLVFDFERFKRGVKKVTDLISPKLTVSCVAIDHAVSKYLKTLFVIMAISFVEYGILYLLVGHHYALMMGVLSAFGLLIPYVGGIIVNVIGFLTALTLPVPRIIVLGIALLILPNIDGYVISPLVYSKRNKVEPLWSLFSFFACSVLFGVQGVFISMPLYFSIQSIMALKANNWVLETDN